jgi:dolichyl-phosphate-mannose-protein mannosyltransferase
MGRDPAIMPTEHAADRFPIALHRIPDRQRRQLYALLVAVILLSSAGVRLWHLARPAEYMFDEIYYAKDAKAIVDGRVRPKPPFRWEAGDEVSWPHPELGKMAIAVGILLFGDRSFGWRLPSVVAGLILLACMYPLARRLGLPPPWALLALLFAAADPLGIVQSRIATLDIFVATWTVLCIYLVLRYAQDGRRLVWLFAAGAAGGGALATKWSGALAVIAALLILLAGHVWAVTRREPQEDLAPAGAADAYAAGPPWQVPAAAQPASAAPRLWDEGTPPWDAPAAAPAATAAPDAVPAGRPLAASRLHVRPPGRSAPVALALVLAAFVALPLAIYMLSYTQYFLAGHTWADWRELQSQMLTFNLHLHATHTYASAAPTWIVDYRPVWYYFKDVKGSYRGVVAIGNPLLWWLTLPALLAAPILALTRRNWLLVPIAALVVVLYLPWFLASRTSFLYYMTPVAPFFAILVAAALMQLSGGAVLPRRAWLAAAGAALATVFLWDPVIRAIRVVGWSSTAIGVVLAVGVFEVVMVPRLRSWRPWLAMAIAGLVIGIVVAFIPVVLALPISPGHFSHITWFRSWI